MPQYWSIHSLKAEQEKFRTKMGKNFQPDPKDYEIVMEREDKDDPWILYGVDDAAKIVIRERNKVRSESGESIYDEVAKWEKEDETRAKEFEAAKKKELTADVEASFREKIINEMLAKSRADIEKEVDRRLAEKKVENAMTNAPASSSEASNVNGEPKVKKKMGRPRKIQEPVVV